MRCCAVVAAHLRGGLDGVLDRPRSHQIASPGASGKEQGGAGMSRVKQRGGGKEEGSGGRIKQQGGATGSNREEQQLQGGRKEGGGAAVGREGGRREDLCTERLW